MHKLNEPWTANVVGRMHRYGIKGDELARKCDYSPQYLSQVLNGKRDYKSEEAKEHVQRIIFDSLENIIKEVEDEYR